MRVLAAACFALALVHCGGGTQPGTDAGNTPDSASGGALALSVSSASYATQISRSSPRSGDQFLIVNMALQNVSVLTPVGGSPAYFSVTLASHLVVSVSGLSSTLPMACRVDVSAAAGGTLTCAIAFELATTDVPQTLVYNDLQGHTASATIPTPMAAPVSPLVGTWVGMGNGAAPFGERWVFNPDGTATLTLDGSSGGCTGMLTYTGFMWMATMTDVTFTGSPTCSGMLACGGSSLSCNSVPAQHPGTCAYSLNSAGDTLTLTCRGSPTTFMRM